MLPESETPWKRLGRLLGSRRTEIAARYKNKNLFAEEREINRRMLWSIETGERDNYGRDTLRAVERAYMLAPGSIGRALACGDLEPSPGSPGAAPRLLPVPPSGPNGSPSERERDKLLAEYPDDEVLQAIGRQRRKKPSMVVAEMLEWLDTQASHSANGAAG